MGYDTNGAWIDLVNGVDYVDAKDINDIAHKVQNLEVGINQSVEALKNATAEIQVAGNSKEYAEQAKKSSNEAIKMKNDIEKILNNIQNSLTEVLEG